MPSARALAPWSRRWLLLAALLAAAQASAQQPPGFDPNERDAEQLFLAGREALKKGELVVAAEKFQRSLDLRSMPGTLLNLAATEEQMGKLVKALEHFEAALKALPEGDERRAEASEKAERIRPRIPMLRIDRAAGAPAEMMIRLEGTPLAASSLGAYQRLDPGTYVVTTAVHGREDRRYEVKLAESSSTNLAVEPGKELTIGAPPVAASRGPTTLQAVGVGALGVGIGALGVGVATGVLAIVAKGDAASACPDAGRCASQTGLDAAARSRAFGAVSTASFAVGLAGAAAGVVLVLVGREKAGPVTRVTGVTGHAHPPVSAFAVPWVSPEGGGLAARVRF